MNHELKTHPEPFAAICRGEKRFEYRYSGDRIFTIGDILLLKEFIPETETFTGETIKVKITYLLSGGQFGVPKDYCIMSIAPLSLFEEYELMTADERKEFSAGLFESVINTIRPGTYPNKKEALDETDK